MNVLYIEKNGYSKAESMSLPPSPETERLFNVQFDKRKNIILKRMYDWYCLINCLNIK